MAEVAWKIIIALATVGLAVWGLSQLPPLPIQATAIITAGWGLFLSFERLAPVGLFTSLLGLMLVTKILLWSLAWGLRFLGYIGGFQHGVQTAQREIEASDRPSGWKWPGFGGIRR